MALPGSSSSSRRNAAPAGEGSRSSGVTRTNSRRIGGSVATPIARPPVIWIAAGGSNDTATARRISPSPASTLGSSPAVRLASAAAASGSWTGSARWTLRTLPPILAFSCAAVPCATIRPWSTRAIYCARRSASSRYWVVNSTVVPSRRISSTTLHSSCRERGSKPVPLRFRRTSRRRALRCGRRFGRGQPCLRC